MYLIKYITIFNLNERFDKMSSNVKSLAIGGSITVINHDNSKEEIHAISDTSKILLTNKDKENQNIDNNKSTVEDLLSSIGKLAFKDEVNLDSVDLNNASQSENGLMSKEDKKKLDTIPDVGFFVDTELSEMSENPVQNKIITKKLNEITVTVDEQLDIDSRNPIENATVTKALNNKVGLYIGPDNPRIPGTIWIEIK